MPLAVTGQFNLLVGHLCVCLAVLHLGQLCLFDALLCIDSSQFVIEFVVQCLQYKFINMAAISWIN